MNEKEDVDRFVEESQTALDDPTQESDSRIENIETENDEGEAPELGEGDDAEGGDGQEMVAADAEEEVSEEEAPAEADEDEVEESEDSEDEPEESDDESDEDESEDDEDSEEDDEEEEDEDEKSSNLPGGGSAEESEDKPKKPQPKKTKQARRVKKASAYSYDALPGGPRVTERGPGVGTGPYGSFNPIEDATDDDWGRGQNDPDYWPGLRDLSASWAQAALPTDPTPSEGYDFGLGFGARGRGIHTPTDLDDLDHSGLPGDTTPPVARSDYYDGDKGNAVRAQSIMPGDGSSAVMELDRDLPGTSYLQQDLANPSGLDLPYSYDFRADPLTRKQ